MLAASGKVLIVTPTVGNSRFLDETVESLNVLPADANWRHVIACPPTQADQLRARYTRSTVVPETANSMYAALNDGARADQQWKWLTYINDDDFFLAGVADLVRSLAAYDPTEPTIVYSRAMFVKPSGDAICEFPIARGSHRLLDYYRIACNPIATHGSFISRAAFERLGGFDSGFRYVGDMDFFVRALQQGMRFFYEPIKSVAFRLHGANLTSDVDHFAAEEARVYAKIHGSLNVAEAKSLRFWFICKNWHSYCRRLTTIKRLRIGSYLASLQRETR